MTTLADVLSVRRQFARSANLERDAENAEPLDGYVATARALDVVERVTAAALGPAGGAWSITGPYGSGKSSLALLLDAAFGPAGTSRGLALDKISAAAPHTGDDLLRALSRHDCGSAGFFRASVTAGREPVARTVLRGVHRAVVRRYGKVPGSAEFPASSVLKLAQRRASSAQQPADASSAELMEIVCCIAAQAPLLVVIDEFGKNLEHASDGPAGDTYLLQQLAEAGQGAGLPIFVVTLQHLSFEDYLADADDRCRRDWAKVQGRFVDVAFTESAAQTRTLMAEALHVDDRRLRRRVDAWAASHAAWLAAAGITEFSDPAAIAACWPLHPVATLVLPELCNRFGQHERTLYSFLAGGEPGTVASLAAGIAVSEGAPLPAVGPEAVYDYFMDIGGAGVHAVGRPGRWTEIATRIRDAVGLSASERRLMKSVALLNLVATTGPARASAAVLGLVDPAAGNVLTDLEGRGLVTYRAFADEYRVWQGTDVDLADLTAAAYERIAAQPLAKLLSEVYQPEPVVAARHSARNETVRWFRSRFAVSGELVDPPAALDAADGELLLVVDAAGPPPRLSDEAARSAARRGAVSGRRWQLRSKPVVAVMPKDVAELERASREAAALLDVLSMPEVRDDWVARREVGERLASARSLLEAALSSAYDGTDCRWTLLDGAAGIPLQAGRGSAPLSEAADLAYPTAPYIPNEMLNRAELTSQGAKARRLLLEAMIERGAECRLGLEGYGPEVAMYEATLRHSGVHRLRRGARAGGGAFVFGRPPKRTGSASTGAAEQTEHGGQGGLSPVWETIEAAFTAAKASRLNLGDLYIRLASPPHGVKTGVIPVIVTAALLSRADRIAVYEHGTFQLGLSPELSERMVRNPHHFEVKHFANVTGPRRTVLDALAARFGIDPGIGIARVGNVLTVTRHLAARTRRLESWTRCTSHLSRRALAVRDALTQATEPDVLLFEALPEALGYPSVPAAAAQTETGATEIRGGGGSWRGVRE